MKGLGFNEPWPDDAALHHLPNRNASREVLVVNGNLVAGRNEVGLVIEDNPYWHLEDLPVR